MLEADALGATNLRIGLEEVGANPAEIEAAREQEEVAQQRYLDQTAIDARRESEAQGMNAEAVKEYVAAKVTGADARLEERWTDFLGGNVMPEKAGQQTFKVVEATELVPPLPTPTERSSEAAMRRT